jgi:hypothetical protein
VPLLGEIASIAYSGHRGISPIRAQPNVRICEERAYACRRSARGSG